MSVEERDSHLAQERAQQIERDLRSIKLTSSQRYALTLEYWSLVHRYGTPVESEQPNSGEAIITSETTSTTSDILFAKRTRLTVREAIIRVLSETERPLNSAEIGHIIEQKQWTRPLSHNVEAVIQGGIRGILSSGNEAGIIVAAVVKRRRTYWLRWRGPAPGSTDELVRRADAARNKAAQVSQQLDQTMAAARDRMEHAEQITRRADQPPQD